MDGSLIAKCVVYCACNGLTITERISNIESLYDEMMEKIKNASDDNNIITINLDHSGELHSESKNVPAIKIGRTHTTRKFYIHYNHGNILTGKYPYYERDSCTRITHHFLSDDTEYRSIRYFEDDSNNRFSKWNGHAYSITDKHSLLDDNWNIVAEFPHDDIWNFSKFKFAD